MGLGYSVDGFFADVAGAGGWGVDFEFLGGCSGSIVRGVQLPKTMGWQWMYLGQDAVESVIAT